MRLKYDAKFDVMATDGKDPVFLLKNQSFFEALYLILSQAYEKSEGSLDLDQDILEIYDIDIRNEKQLRELNIMIDYDESDDFSNWEVEHNQFLVSDHDPYLLARVFEHLLNEYTSIYFEDNDLYFKAFNFETTFNVSFFGFDGLSIHAKLVDGGDF